MCISATSPQGFSRGLLGGDCCWENGIQQCANQPQSWVSFIYVHFNYPFKNGRIFIQYVHILI